MVTHLSQAVLAIYFAAQPDVYVSGNLMCYYEEDNPKKSISPDVFVVRGAAKGDRRVYKFWEEPVPQVVLEISSRKTRKEDFGKKKNLYAWLGVREYFVFDPDAKCGRMNSCLCGETSMANKTSKGVISDDEFERQHAAAKQHG